MRELYVYYKLSPSNEPQARQRVDVAQGELRQAYPGLSARLLQRPDLGSDGMRTWMEVYAMSDDAGSAGIDTVIEGAIAHAMRGLDPLLASPRHVEVFIACA